MSDLNGERRGAREPAVLVIFGGTGDLAKRKLFPALTQSVVEGLIHDQTQFVGVGRQQMADSGFRSDIERCMHDGGFSPDQLNGFLSRVHYLSIGEYAYSDFQSLRQGLQTLLQRFSLPRNYAFYLALPPDIMPKAVAGLHHAGLNDSTRGWTRVILEKPFGRDLSSARKLNDLIHNHFTEKQIFRIDHFLGKETVQNLLVFRLANGFIESSWNRDRIECVQITVAETLGVGSRAGYYDDTGALRDIVQNHMIQLLTLVAMEPPVSFSAEAIRYEKVKVLRQIAPILMANVVRGQYTAGEIGGSRVAGYLSEANVASDSDTETFVALKLYVDSWRWQGVPFYLRTGKRLAEKTSQIIIRYRDAPVSLFRSFGRESHTPNLLTLTLQPDEGFSIHIGVKVPGYPFRLQRSSLKLRYQDIEGGMPEAYQTLLLDVLAGDQTLFVNADEVEESWRLFTPLQQNPPKCVPYASGTWGPEEADVLAIPEHDLWQESV